MEKYIRYIKNGDKRKQTRMYRTWGSMKSRCLNKNHKSYKHYGDRGIKVCKRWMNSFENFVDDMGDRPDGMSIERIDNEGGYEPKSCKWATSKEQSLNKRLYTQKKRRKNIKCKYKGAYWNEKEQKFRARIRFKGKTIELGRFDDEEKAAIAYDLAAKRLFNDNSMYNKTIMRESSGSHQN